MLMTEEQFLPGALNERYPDTLDSTAMDRYKEMSFSYNHDTGAMAASMYRSILKLLATFSTSSLPEQSTPYTLDLFDISEDLKDSLVGPSGF